MITIPTWFYVLLLVNFILEVSGFLFLIIAMISSEIRVNKYYKGEKKENDKRI